MPSPVAPFRSGLIVATLLASLFLGAPEASASTLTSRSGNVSATFSYSGTFPQSRDPRLTISRSGKVIDRVFISSKWCGHQCWPNMVSSRQSVLHVVRLRQSGPLDVVLDLYSGGAHCCAIEQVYYFNSTSRRYIKSEYDFGDPGIRLVPLGKGGSDVFLSADDNFAYAFTDYAASAMPIKILNFFHGAFHNVTRSFPLLIAEDAHQLRRAFVASAATHYQDSVGIAAAWAADEDMLGHVILVRNFLIQEARARHLNSALSPMEPNGQKFVLSLHKFLRLNGYEK